MASSTISKNILTVTGSYTGASNESTFQFAPMQHRTWLILGGDIPITLLVDNGTTASARNPVTGEAFEVVANGNYNFTLKCFGWYINPKALAIV